MTSFSSQLRTIIAADEDFEWYPTTNEILEKLKEHLLIDAGEDRGRYGKSDRFLDIGAGNGKVLDFVSKFELFNSYYAIEKSQTHLSNLDPSYFILGVDFWSVNLFDKEVSTIFCNPPYSEYDGWVEKILREAPAGCAVYCVIPERWKNSKLIKSQIDSRDVEVKIIGSFSFQDSEDRAARANVELIKFTTENSWEKTDETDPFRKFFNETFKYPEPKEEKFDFESKINEHKLVHSQNLIETLCFLYDARMKELQENYTAICKLDYEILKEFEISRESLIKSLEMKLENTKKQFWQRLFDGMKSINRLLTHDSRKNILQLMQAQTGIDFNRDNAYAIVMWVIKNANTYFDKQFIATYERMLNLANIENYKSNQRVFTDNHFRYYYYKEEAPDVSHVKLKVGHRIVLANCGGLRKTDYSFDKGLEERAAHFIGDLLTIANNLGYIPVEPNPYKGDWDTSEAVSYHFKRDGKMDLLFKVRAYHNGNLHFQFNPDFIHAMNVLHGRLKGWVGSETEAEEEIGVPVDIAQKFYHHSFGIKENQLLLK